MDLGQAPKILEQDGQYDHLIIKSVAKTVTVISTASESSTLRECYTIDKCYYSTVHYGM